MKIFKPTWVNHDGNPIFSIDIHPDGTRFATGGQGPDKCGRLIIWNMGPILSENDESKDSIPKLLCQLDNHLACINCVRWSNHGKYLCSAGDDKNLMIWQLAGRINHYNHHHQSNNVFESSNVEQWKCISTLNGHSGDILDLAWSPSDCYLASCSVDNMIIVWDANNFPQLITKIVGHTGLVKGVSWDPTGKYLASQSDDKTLRVWHTSDWREEVVVKEPFKECSGTTHVLRLNWSPDGQMLVSAHAMNNSGSVAQLIERDGWKTQRDLVGHRKAVTCVRFNPNILYQNKTKKQASERNSSNGTSLIKSSNGTKAASNKTVRYNCLALGSRDRSISVWLTSQPRPLIVTHDLFENSVLDLSWSADGYRLLACSQDGTIAVMIFSPNELGQKLSLDEKQAFFQKLYGKSITAAIPANKPILVEDPELLKSEQINRRTKEIIDLVSSHSNSISQNGFGESNTSMSQMSKGPTDRQIETYLPGGKRRITPLYIQPNLAFNPSANITFSSSKESKTKILIETTTSNPTPIPTSYTPTTPVKATSILGIKREFVPSKPTHKTLTPSKIEKATVFKIVDSNGRKLTLEAENEALNTDKMNELRLLDDSNERIWDVLISNRISSVIATQTYAITSCVDNSIHIFDMNSGIRLRPPLVLDSGVAHIAAQKGHLLVITTNANVWLWDLLRNKSKMKNESISSLLTSPIGMNEKTQNQKSQSKSDKPGKTSTDNDNNVQSQSDIEVTSCSLTEFLQPLILLSNSKAYLYDFELSCWSLISDSRDSITRWSSYKPSLNAMKRYWNGKQVTFEDSRSLKKHLPLTSLQSQHAFDIKRLANTAGKGGSECLQIKATRSYLDQQLASAYSLRSPHEYQYWLIQSVQHYIDTGSETRLKEICSRLLSSSSSFGLNGDEGCKRDGSDNYPILNTEAHKVYNESNNEILGINKKDLLREILTIISKDLRYQRIYSEYKQLLEYETSSSIADFVYDMKEMAPG